MENNKETNKKQTKFETFIKENLEKIWLKFDIEELKKIISKYYYAYIVFYFYQIIWFFDDLYLGTKLFFMKLYACFSVNILENIVIIMAWIEYKLNTLLKIEKKYPVKILEWELYAIDSKMKNKWNIIFF